MGKIEIRDMTSEKGEEDFSMGTEKIRTYIFTKPFNPNVMNEVKRDLHTKLVPMISLDEYWEKRKNVSVIDVRTPNEYRSGTIPGAINIPLLSQEAHHEIGILYKNKGQEDAVGKGYEILEEYWPDLIAKLKTLPSISPLVVFCARGGKRSQIMANILFDLHYKIDVLEGGYKRFRNWNLKRFENLTFENQLFVLDGMTGVGKTRILLKLQNYIDLEGLAQHRSSVFGAIGKTPVSTKTFEACLIEALDSLETDLPIFIEGESRKIGDVIVPKKLFDAMKSGKRILLTASIETRVKRIADDYLPKNQTEHDQLVKGTMSLESFLGKKNISKLVSTLNQGQYLKFFKFMLEEYYDKKYCNSMKNYKYYAVIDAENESSAANNLLKLR